jgi:hypothetical protein
VHSTSGGAPLKLAMSSGSTGLRNQEANGRNRRSPDEDLVSSVDSMTWENVVIRTSDRLVRSGRGASRAPDGELIRSDGSALSIRRLHLRRP